MRFPEPLIPGRLIKRYKRFLADVALASGETVTAHCANPGSMKSVDETGARVWLSRADNPKRKLAYTWELIEVGGALVGINTALPNRLAEEAIGAGAIPRLSGYAELRREVRYGTNSRIDLLLHAPERRDCFVEVKSVTMRRAVNAEFPDAVTKRGAKHLAELAREAGEGKRAVMLYLVQRGDCPAFSVAADIDPEYARALVVARAAGVEILCHACRVSPEGIEVADAVQLDL